MKITRVHIILASMLLVLASGGAVAYFKYKKISNYLVEQLSGQAAKKLGRQIKFKKASFSPLEGVVIEEACVSRVPDFSKGSFFCAARTVIRPKFSALMRNQVYFSKVAFERPVIKVREKGGVWDFADLLALLPETDKGVYLTWNTSELTMKDALFEADMETSGLSVALENAELSLEHFSSYGGNYGLSFGGLVKTAVKGKLLSSQVRVETDANFDYAGLSSLKGSFTAADATYGAMTLQSLKADCSLFNLRKPLAEKNYSVSLTAENLLIPGQETSIKDNVSKALSLFSSAMGKPAPKIEDIEMPSLKAEFRLDDSVLAFKNLALRTNFLELDAGLSINGPEKTADAGLDLAIGSNKIKMSASGPMSEPQLKPVLSDTLSRKFKESLADIEKSLLKTFPVTGEVN